jgi:hypothetical protein
MNLKKKKAKMPAFYSLENPAELPCAAEFKAA